MVIKEVNLFHVRMPLLEPWVTAYGSQNDIESLQSKSDEAEGWGECAPAPLPLYNTEYTKGAFAVARDVFAPQLIARTSQRPINCNQYSENSRDMNLLDQRLTLPGGMLTRINAISHFGR